MNLNHLNYFRTLGKTLYYTGAAEELNISQPSLSYAIRILEQELGIELFERSGRNVVLTKHGEEFWKEVDFALGILEASQDKVKRMATSTAGLIDFAFIYTLGADYIPELLKAYIAECGEDKPAFNTYQESTTKVIEYLKQGKIDLGFCSYVENEPEIKFTPICQQELVLITPKNHPLSNRDSVSIKETCHYDFISYSSTSGLYNSIEALYDGLDRNISLTVEEDSAVLGLVQHGFGIAVIPNIKLINSFDVDVIKINDIKQTRYIYLAELQSKYQPLTIQNFINFIKENYSQE